MHRSILYYQVAPGMVPYAYMRLAESACDLFQSNTTEVEGANDQHKRSVVFVVVNCSILLVSLISTNYYYYYYYSNSIMSNNNMSNTANTASTVHSFMDKLKKGAKGVVDAGAKQMLKVGFLHSVFFFVFFVLCCVDC